MSTYPSTIAVMTNPTPTQRLNSPSHSSIESAQNNEIIQIQNVVGTDSSTLGTIIGDLRNSTSGGGGHVQAAQYGGTGQTTFSTGDILVAKNSSDISKLAVGTNGQSLKADSSASLGVSWGNPALIPTVRIYSNASVITWAKPSVLSYIIVKAVAGGASGGGATTTYAAGGGGGGGGYSEIKIPASSLSATVRVNIGGSVLAGTGAGTAGIYSGFGGYASCVGGAAGTTNNNSGGGDGGTSTGGDINITGGKGDGGLGLSGAAMSIGGGGGSSPLGFGGAMVTKTGSGTITGNAGVGYGSGGGGGATADTSDATGGTGAQGIVIVEEY